MSTAAESLLQTGLGAQAVTEPGPEYGTGWLLGQVKPGQSAFEALVEAWLSTFGSENTVAAYRTDIKAWRLYCAKLSPPVDPLLADDKHGDGFAEFMRAAGLDEDTRRRRLAAVSSCYRYALTQRVRADNPLARTARPPRPGVRGPRLRAGQVRALLGAAEASTRPYAARDRVMLRLMARCDVGVLALCALNFGDLQMHPFPVLEVRLPAARRTALALPADVYDVLRVYLPTRLDPVEARGAEREHTELEARAPLFYLQSPRLQGQRLSRGTRITRAAVSTRLRSYAGEIAAEHGISPQLLAVLGPADIRGVLADDEPAGDNRR